MEKSSQGESNSERMTLESYVRVALLGAAGSGKSALAQALAAGEVLAQNNDKRVTGFSHKHERDSGRTSSISQTVVGFDADGKQVLPPPSDDSSVSTNTAEVVRLSSKVVALVDLCGSEKYLKTTMLGICGAAPDYALLVVDASVGLKRTAKEHLGLALAQTLPLILVITKADTVAAERLQATLDGLVKLLTANLVGKLPVPIGSDTSALNDTADQLTLNRVCPIFTVSSATGAGLSTLTRFLHTLRERPSKALADKSSAAEFDVLRAFDVPSVGLVASGLLRAGTLRPGAQLQLGPSKSGEYRQVQVRSVHLHRLEVNEARAGQLVCLAIRSLKKKDELEPADVRRGNVLLDANLAPKACWGFEAGLAVLHHSATLKLGSTAVAHCGVTRQSVQLTRLDRNSLRCGDKGTACFKFMFGAEHIRPNSTFLLRDGRTLALGFITRVFHRLDELPE